MNETHEHTIVVGFDGSAGAEAALDWAVKEAEMRGVGLCVVQSWTPGEFGRDEEVEAYTQDHLRQQVADRMKDSTVPWEAFVFRGAAAKVLLEHSADADMLVVGSRGRGGFTGLLLGSVSQQVSSHAGARAVAIIHS